MNAKIFGGLLVALIVFLIIAGGLGGWGLVDKGSNKGTVIAYGIFSSLVGMCFIGFFLAGCIESKVSEFTK